MVEDKLKFLSEDFNKALSRLKEALVLPETEINRDAAIQRFEFTFELAWKLMKTTNEILGTPCYSPRDCIRLAARNGILDNPENQSHLRRSRRRGALQPYQKLSPRRWEIA